MLRFWNKAQHFLRGIKPFVRLSVCFAHQRTRSRPNYQGVWVKGERGLVDYPPDGIKPPSPFIPLSWRQLILDVLHSIQPTELNQPLLLASRAYRNRRRRARWTLPVRSMQRERVCQKHSWHPPSLPLPLMGENGTNLIPCRVFERYRIKFDPFMFTLLFVRSFLTNWLQPVIGSSLKCQLIVLKKLYQNRY